jgi:hypothetical protein
LIFGSHLVNKKEIKMFTNRLFNLIVAAVLVAVGARAIQGVSRPVTIIPNTGDAPLEAQSVPEAGAQGVAHYVRAHSNPSAQVVLDASVQSVADYIRLHSNDLSFREYQLGERYGALPEHVAWFSAEQIHREYILGERYGVMPQQDARNKSYRNPLDVCYDVPIRELAACRIAGQASVQSNRPSLDECLDVSNISERAICREASQASAP